MRKRALITGCLSLAFLVACSSADEKARTLYNQALTAQREGKGGDARKLLEQVAKDYPQTESATKANELLNTVAAVEAAVSGKATDSEKATALNMRTINTAAVTNLSMTNGHFPSKLSDLVKAELLDSTFLQPTKGGYILELKPGGTGYVVTGRPAVPGVTGRRFFYSNESAEIRYEFDKEAGPESSKVDF